MDSVGRISEAWSDEARAAAAVARRRKRAAACSGGDCYQAAFNLATAGGKGLSLYHGTVTGQGALSGVPYGHAWVEREGSPFATVLDHSNGRELEMPAPVYRAIGRARDLRRYSPEEARALALRTGHYGPWPA